MHTHHSSHTRTSYASSGTVFYGTKQEDSELTCRDDDPRRVEAHVVDPEILELRATVHDVPKALRGVTGRIVQRDAVQMGDADDDLERVAQAAAVGDGHGGSEAQRAPYGLVELAGLPSASHGFLVLIQMVGGGGGAGRGR